MWNTSKNQRCILIDRLLHYLLKNHILTHRILRKLFDAFFVIFFLLYHTSKMDISTGFISMHIFIILEISTIFI